MLNFVVYGAFILVRNCIRYMRYGVMSTSDYYTQEQTLKVGSLLLSLFGGEMLFAGLISFFYIQQMSYQYGVVQSINTSLLSLVALVLLMAAYFGFGIHVRMQQTIGAFITIVGSLCMYIALSGSITSHTEGEAAESTTIANSILGLNGVAAICLSGVFIILKVNHKNNQIKYHSGIFMITFISFLTSAIILTALQCLTLLTDANVRDAEAPISTSDPNARQQMWQITMASACFSLGLTSLGAVLDRRPTTRSLSLFCLIPLA